MADFVVRSAGKAPLIPGFAAALPLQATVLTSLPDIGGEAEFWCARLAEPVKYHLDASFDHTRAQAEFLDVDRDGEFLWVTVIAVWPIRSDQRLHANMQGIGVQVAYVIDQTLGRDRYFDVRKVDVVGAALVDDGANPVPTGQPELALITPSEPVAPLSLNVGGLPSRAASRPHPPSRDRDDDQQPAAMTEAQVFRYELGRLRAISATLTGIYCDLPVEAPHDPGLNPGRATYVVQGDRLRYHRHDREKGWHWITADDLNGLLRWLVFDMVQNAAWQWSANAPIAATGIEAREAIATDFRRTLLLALNIETSAQMPA